MAVRATSTAELRLELEDEVKFSSQWMLNQLLSYLSPYMLYKCIIKKYGILLYHKGGDLATVSYYLGASAFKIDDFEADGSDTAIPDNKHTLTLAGEIIHHLKV